MQIHIYKRGCSKKRVDSETLVKEIKRDTDLHLWTNLHQMLESMEREVAYDNGRPKYFSNGYIVEGGGSVYLDLEVGEMCERARATAQSYIREVANFFGVSEDFIDHISFCFE